jgi:hypothetical protein
MTLRARGQTWLRRPTSWLRFLMIPALCGTLATGCYTNSNLTRGHLEPLRQGGWTQELVIRDDLGRNVRLGPNTDVRFLRVDGNWTAWLSGGEICVSPTEVNHCAQARLPGLPWSAVQGMEVRNLEGGTTYVVVLAVVVIVAVVVLMVAGGGKGGGGGGGGGGLKALDGLGKGMTQVARGVGQVARGMANFSYRVLEATARGWRWYGPQLPPGQVDIVVAPPPPAYAPPIYTPLPPALPPAPEPPPPEVAPAPDADGQATTEGPPPPEAAPPAEALPPLPPAPPPPPPVIVRQPMVPLFTPRTTRRGKIRLVTAVDGGSDFTVKGGGTFSAFVGMRLSEVMELGGGLRLFSGPETPDDPHTKSRTSPIAFGRIAAHFDVDSARRVALPIGFDAGGGDSRAYVRLMLGIRIRVWDTLSLGLYPFNPTFVMYSNDDRQRRDLAKDAGWFQFPSTFEVLWTY